MAHPYKSQARTGAQVARARYMADGGEVKVFPITLGQADNNRMRLERAISAAADRYGVQAAEAARSRLPVAKILLGPGANK